MIRSVLPGLYGELSNWHNPPCSTPTFPSLPLLIGLAGKAWKGESQYQTPNTLGTIRLLIVVLLSIFGVRPTTRLVGCLGSDGLGLSDPMPRGERYRLLSRRTIYCEQLQ